MVTAHAERLEAIGVMRVAALLGLAMTALGCGLDRPVFVCTSGLECGAEGVCDVLGACSIVDDTCSSGRRFSELSPSTLASRCVPLRCERWQDCGAGGACDDVTDACVERDDTCDAGWRHRGDADFELADTCVEVAGVSSGGGYCRNDDDCNGQRACTEGRCLSTVSIDAEDGFFAGVCALTAAPAGGLLVWGDVPLVTEQDVSIVDPGFLNALVDGCEACVGINYRPPCSETCPGTAEVLRASAGADHLCMVTPRQGSFCVGADAAGGRLGPYDQAMPAPLSVRHLPAFSLVAAGGAHSCGAYAFGNLRSCFGANGQGQLGDASAGGPTPVDSTPFAGRPEHLAATGDVGCAATSDDVICTGAAPLGAPGFVAGLGPGPITELEVSDSHACVVKGGRAWCWGDNTFGQVDPGSPSATSPPHAPLGDVEVVDVATGARHSCARTSTAQVWCWGDDASAQIGGAGVGPAQIMIPAAVGSLVAERGQTCVLTAFDRVQCWGDDVIVVNSESFADFVLCERADAL